MDFKEIFKDVDLKDYDTRYIPICILDIIWINFMLKKFNFDTTTINSCITGLFATITFLGTVLTICTTWKTSKEKKLIEGYY